jgi:hypothetical protein
MGGSYKPLLPNYDPVCALLISTLMVDVTCFFSKRWYSRRHVSRFLSPEEYNVNNRSHEILQADSHVPPELLQ